MWPCVRSHAYTGFSNFVKIHGALGKPFGLNCRIPRHFEAAPLKRLDTRIRSRKYHPSPGKLLTILRSGYADTRIRGYAVENMDTRIRGYADITHGNWIPTSCNILQNALYMWIRGYAVESTSRIVSVIRPKHSRRILAFILHFR